MPATLRDIAKRLGISVSTVSYALNGGPRPVPEEIRQKVLEVARELDYRPNRLARSMVTGKTETVAVVPPVVTRHMLQSPYIHAILSNIADAVGEHGYDILLHTSATPMDDTTLVSSLLSGKVDGILLIAPPSTSQVPQQLRQRHVPCVVLSARVEGLPCVYADNAAGIVEALDWLMAYGHSRIGYIGGPITSYDAQQRLIALMDYVREHQLHIPPEWVAEGDFTAEGAKAGARRMLSHPERPTAILAANDEAAAGVIQVAQEMGIEVPQALSVIGFDDTPFAQVLSPRLSTVRQPLDEMASEAVRLLMDWIEQREPPRERDRVFPTTLVLRDSTAPAPIE
ncbi:MAG: LacI family DNA-binding transcriptional regulator [Armatimonadota bacterium]|nr:LacI family transcriptional regulator [bacterium]MCS7309947.1 LacI family transcriptional regulator [Armatimonadota bacterium]MDW8103781.1 LacI family DNA-binding transcriptional regulator [Armatimonadota bacterium]MDW8290644.1 LacI family DNA-binding transcriptional regulator [Armatimonadota bacterium]